MTMLILAAQITPENVPLAIFILGGGPFLLGVILELLTGYAIRRGGFRFCSREDDPSEYWFSICVHSSIVIFFGIFTFRMWMKG